jgi:2',3'-cyclic-nucleotide 2'-phosphodiesterase (5'-nucleotidase family)
MRRFSFSIFVVLSLFSCSRYLTVSQVNTKNTPVEIRNTSIDSLTESVVKPYRDSIEHDMAKLVGVTATALVKGKPESKLTNLVADIILKYAKDYCAEKQLNINPDAAYVNYGGLRASLPQGKVTVGHIFELMPFENEIVLIKVSGEAIQKMAERIAGRGGEGVSGLKLGIRSEKVGTLTVGGKTIDPAASYWLVTNDYIANGGDQMSMFIVPLDKIETKAKIRDILIQSLNEMYKKNGVIDVKEDGRIYNEQ